MQYDFCPLVEHFGSFVSQSASVSLWNLYNSESVSILCEHSTCLEDKDGHTRRMTKNSISEHWVY